MILPAATFRLATALRGSPVRGYAFAGLAFAAALFLRLHLDDSLPAGFPYLTFFPAVIITAFVAGTGPGVAVSFACGLAAWYAFIPPKGTFELDGGKALALAFYAFIVAVDLALIHFMAAALRRLAQERARSQALAENRETLFKELQHRISNNLQIVSSLMLLQRGGVSDPAAAKALDEAAKRLALIGSIHRRLHDPAGQQVGFDAFLKDLCHDILESSGAANVACRVTADPIPLPSERIIPVALIMTECVSNALEHGFGDGRAGTIAVELAPARREGWLDLTVRDDGAGLAPGFDLAATRSLGLRLVRALAGQIGGEFALSPRGGTECRLSFPA